MITRVHSDRESGLIAIESQLCDIGVQLTLTQGYDPQANGDAECAVGLICWGARKALTPLRDVGYTQTDLKVLWPVACVHSAMVYNVAHDKRPNPRITAEDLAPFGATVHAKKGPLKKVSKTGT